MKEVKRWDIGMISDSDGKYVQYEDYDRLLSHRCDECGANISDYPTGCPRCGAPQCCPMCCKVDSLTAERDYLTAEHDRLCDALAQYANKRNWTRNEMGHLSRFLIDTNGPYIARVALKEVER